MEPQSIIYILVVAFSIGAIAMLSVAEASIIAANKYKIRSLMDKGDKRAQALKRILDEHDKFFSAVIVSGNLFTILATSIGTTLAVEHLGEGAGVIAATIVMTFLTVVFGELTPKTLAVSYSDRLALFLAKPLEIYIKVVAPLVWLFSGILKLFGVRKGSFKHLMTEDEIKAMISIGEQEGALEVEERQMLHRVFEFGDMEVSEVMVPRTEIVSIPGEATVSDAMALVSQSGYARYPVVKESIDNIIGMLYIKDILIKMAEGSATGETPLTDLTRDPYFVPENKMVTELLDEMQKKSFHIAIVIDEYGGTDGLITLEDIMEKIVGELQDEFEAIEAEKEVEVIDERTFIVSGQTDIDEINELVGTEISSEDFNTIGGFVFGLFGRLPRIGEQVRLHNLRFLVMEMDERKIGKIKITKL